MTALLFLLLTACLVFNVSIAYNMWTVSYDDYHPWARYVVMFCAVGTVLCYIRAILEVLK